MATKQRRKIAILATDGFEESELVVPRDELKSAGMETFIVSPKPGEIRAWKDKNWGSKIKVDRELRSVCADEFDALVLPGGVMNPDTLRMNPDVVNFVRQFIEEEKPIGAICHGPWTLIEADGVDGRRITSWPSLRTDIENAGGIWVDESVVVDNGLVTSRKPADLPDFVKKLKEEIEEGSRPRRTESHRGSARPRM